MRFLILIVGVATAGLALAAPASDKTAHGPKKRATKFEYVGINESGAEFGKNDLPGTLGKHYTWPVHSTIDVCGLDLLAPSSTGQD